MQSGSHFPINATIPQQIEFVKTQYLEKNGNISDKEFTAEAEIYLAKMYDFGKTVTQNTATAVQLLFSASSKGYASAQYSLGYTYETGDGLKQDSLEAARLFRLSAEQGDQKSLNQLQRMTSPYGTYQLAIYYKNRSNLNDVPLPFIIDILKRYPDDYAIIKAYLTPQRLEELDEALEQALEPSRLSSILKNASAPFTDHTSIMVDVERDAKELYEEGLEFLEENGTVKNLEAAERSISLAAHKGYADAQFHLAKMYGESKDRKKLKEVVPLLSAAAEKGHPRAQMTLGYFYQRGIAVKKDLSKAVAYYRSAVKLGNDQAQYRLGLCYLKGEGLPQDKKEAMRLLRLGAEKKFDKALKELKSLANGYWGFFGDPYAKYHVALLEKKKIPTNIRIVIEMIEKDPNDLVMIEEHQLLKPTDIQKLKNLIEQRNVLLNPSRDVISPDISEAHRLLEQAAKAGSENAKFRLFYADWLYHQALQHLKVNNNKDAAEYLRNAAESGSKKAFHRLKKMAQGPFWGLFGGGNHDAIYQLSCLQKKPLPEPNEDTNASTASPMEFKMQKSQALTMAPLMLTASSPVVKAKKETEKPVKNLVTVPVAKASHAEPTEPKVNPCSKFAKKYSSKPLRQQKLRKMFG